MQKRVRNSSHPELLKGEIFLGNSEMGEQFGSWETKRVGEKAYSMLGKPLPMTIKPVFAIASEKPLVAARMVEYHLEVEERLCGRRDQQKLADRMLKVIFKGMVVFTEAIFGGSRENV